MIPLEFTCTSMRRPAILRETLESFEENLRGVDFGASTCYLNIDPFPDTDGVGEMLKLAESVFGVVSVNTPDVASFPAAVKWCWTRPSGKTFFHLEDDWRLLHPVYVADMQAALKADTSLSVVNLRAYNHDDDRICLAPGLWRTIHAREIAEKLKPHANPERQLRPKGKTNPHGGLHVGYKGKQFPANLIVLRDLGRTWMELNGLKRDGGRLFTKWAKKP